MEWIVLSFIVISIALFVFRECVVLYIARVKSFGLILESTTLHFFRQHTNQHIQRLDYLLITTVTLTLLMYAYVIVQKIIDNPGIQELTVLEAGIALLLYIIFPSRKITHFITENGLEERGKTTKWNHIYAINVADEAAVRRMLHVSFKGTTSSVEGYMYNRDLGNLKQLVAPHSITLSEQ